MHALRCCENRHRFRRAKPRDGRHMMKRNRAILSEHSPSNDPLYAVAHPPAAEKMIVKSASLEAEDARRGHAAGEDENLTAHAAKRRCHRPEMFSAGNV